VGGYNYMMIGLISQLAGYFYFPVLFFFSCPTYYIYLLPHPLPRLAIHFGSCNLCNFLLVLSAKKLKRGEGVAIL